MTPTEQLRRMLDERGLEHIESEDSTTIFFDAEGNKYTYHVDPKSGWAQLYGYHITPAQAIAATVGNRTELSKRLRDVRGLHAFAELFGFSWEDETDRTWHDVACAMADAVDAATVAAGTCEMRDAEGSFCSVNRPAYICECGAFCTDYSDATTYFKPRYCPNCGRRVEMGDA